MKLTLTVKNKREVSEFDRCQGKERNPKCSLGEDMGLPGRLPPALSSHSSRHFVSAVPKEVPGGHSLRVSAAHIHFGAKTMAPQCGSNT